MKQIKTILLSFLLLCLLPSGICAYAQEPTEQEAPDLRFVQESLVNWYHEQGTNKQITIETLQWEREAREFGFVFVEPQKTYILRRSVRVPALQKEDGTWTPDFARLQTEELAYDFAPLNGTWSGTYSAAGRYISNEEFKLILSGVGVLQAAPDASSSVPVQLSHDLNDVWSEYASTYQVSFSSGQLLLHGNDLDAEEPVFFIQIPLTGFYPEIEARLMITATGLSYSDPNEGEISLSRQGAPAEATSDQKDAAEPAAQEEDKPEEQKKLPEPTLDTNVEASSAGNSEREKRGGANLLLPLAAGLVAVCAAVAAVLLSRRKDSERGAMQVKKATPSPERAEMKKPSAIQEKAAEPKPPYDAPPPSAQKSDGLPKAPADQASGMKEKPRAKVRAPEAPKKMNPDSGETYKSAPASRDTQPDAETLFSLPTDL